MRVGLVFNVPGQSRYHARGEGLAVESVLESVEAVDLVLTGQGHEVLRVGLEPPLSAARMRLASLQVDLVFNLFEGFDGLPETEWEFAQAVEMLGIPFTGASSDVLSLCLDKARAKEALSSQGVPTAPFQVLDTGGVGRFCLSYPVIVKPVAEDASHGLGEQSVVCDRSALERQVAFVEEAYGGRALVEEFLGGREFNVSVLGGDPTRVLPPSEIVYSGNGYGPRLLTYAAKWLEGDAAYQDSVSVCPAQMGEGMAREIEEIALAAHTAVGAPAYARVDLRADATGRSFVLEVNPNPDLAPGAGMAKQAVVAGLGYDGLISSIVALALHGKDVVAADLAADAV